MPDDVYVDAALSDVSGDIKTTPSIRWATKYNLMLHRAMKALNARLAVAVGDFADCDPRAIPDKHPAFIAGEKNYSFGMAVS